MTHAPVHHGEKNNGKEILKRFLAIAGALVGFQFFFFQEGGSVSFVLQALIFMAFLTAVFVDPKNIAKQIPVLIGGYVVFALLGWMIVTRAYWLVQSMSAVLVVIHLIYFAYLLAQKSVFIHSISELVSVPFRMGSAYLRHWFQSFTQLVSGKFAPEKTHLFHITGAIRKAVVGIAISIPVIAILIYLLTSADPIYASFIKGWFTQPFINTLSTFGERLIPTAFIFLFLLPFLTFQIVDRSQPPHHLFAKFRLVHEVTIMMVLVAIVLASFILIQWPYIFTQVATEADLSDFGIETYSEYVRRGFGELLRVSVFVYGLVWVGLITYRNRKTDAKTILPIIQMVVLGILLVFIFSIFRRVWLYQDYHGWTLIRIYGSIFLGWLMLITGTLALRHFYLKRWIMVEVFLTVCVIAFIGLFNAERFIVLNHPPTVNEQVDHVYLSRMSPDGYEGWKESVLYAESVVKKNPSGKDGIIPEYDRRQIAYGHFITLRMLQNYHRLIGVYGTDEEKREYAQLVLNEIRRTTEEQTRRENNPDYVNVLENVSQELAFMQQLIDENPEDFNTDLFIENLRLFVSDWNANLSHTVAPEEMIDPDRYLGRGVFSQRKNFKVYQLKLIGHRYGTEFTEASQEKLKEAYVTENSARSNSVLLKWNASETDAYERMKEDISLVDLIAMENQYTQLHSKIRSQPDGEREINIDISFTAPLLYPVW